MTLEQALQIIETVTANVQGTRALHVQIAEAVEIIKRALANKRALAKPSAVVEEKK